ncbi:protein of unknown function DUF861 cupin_3 [Nitrosococcus halophilus Nc 4]|uniref:(S)-ureidoglycine aminohydrolase cupin domain-containing protein n=1 Tax=Nitrosococcus halophilus (strain Nc4) TaxID=472759 RepID=D5BXV9_NITHN|nr:cupin domain-containing protein [Nitrosococcus halophilus]ADE15870.1 protein of unknown function DUF861 cupin_3 [Nitrosococcus halophilus Nc 4]
MSENKNIELERHPSPERLEQLGVTSWPTWECGISTFPWHYDSTEIGYFLEGTVTVTPEGGEPLQVSQGDLVTFPAGMSCTWEVHHPVKKHYTFK